MRHSIQIECSLCGGTGLYAGFAEPEGTAVICNGCGGTGARTFTYKRFTHRKQKRGIKRVMNYSLWYGRTKEDLKDTVSYAEFKKNIPPAVPERYV